jgi:hypothetical protein
MAFLTDQTFTTGVTLSHLIHVVDPFDTSQGNLAGSSYKATIEQVLSGFTGTTLYEIGSGTDSTQRIGTSSDSSGNCSVVSGGISNTVLGLAGFVGGGGFNTVSGDRSVITGGGGSCSGLGNKTLCNYNFIGGGIQNVVNGTFSSIVGGGSISGGNGNIINSCYSTIIGGFRNIINHDFSTVIGSNITTQSACTLHTNYLLLYNSPQTDDTNNNILVRDTITGIVKTRDISQQLNYSTTAITTSQTLTWGDIYWGVRATSNVDLVLPTTTSKDGYFLIIKDEVGTSGTYRIRLTPTSGLIDGNSYVDMNINYMSLTIMVRNGNWYLI